MYLKYLIMFFLLSCTATAKTSNEFDMVCEDINFEGTNDMGKRCENKEAVCYVKSNDSLSCFPK